MTGLAVEAAAPFFRDPAKTAAQVRGEANRDIHTVGWWELLQPDLLVRQRAAFAVPAGTYTLTRSRCCLLPAPPPPNTPTPTHPGDH